MTSTPPKRTGLIGMFLVLLVGTGGGIGATLMLEPGELDHAFVCSNSGQVGIFYGGISSSGYTAYPFVENRTGSKTCSFDGVKGTWMKCADYASLHGKNCAEIVSETVNAEKATVLRQELVNVDGSRIYVRCVEE